jgi:Holliday junction DNA helicase RuvA
MIAKLTGILDSTGEDWVILDVNGVGYLVSCSGQSLRRLPAIGQRLSLLIEPVMRNEQLHLYGFMEASEQDWFRLLLTVQGVGAKVGLSILTALTPNEIAQAIINEDKTSMMRADGVGGKLASRLISELKDKVNTLAVTTSPSTVIPFKSTMNDAVSALVNLGYRRHEAIEAVAKSNAQEGSNASAETLIRTSLQLLSQEVNHA